MNLSKCRAVRETGGFLAFFWLDSVCAFDPAFIQPTIAGYYASNSILHVPGGGCHAFTPKCCHWAQLGEGPRSSIEGMFGSHQVGLRTFVSSMQGLVFVFCYAWL